MRSALALCLLAVASLPSSARSVQGLDVEVLKGTFEAHQHDETPEAGTVDDRKLTVGTLELHRIGPGHWQGTATATLGMELRLDSQGVITTVIGHGTESGTVDLVLDVSPPGAYHLTWNLASIDGRTTVDIPASNIHQSRATPVAYAGTGGFESHGVLPAEGGDLIGKNEHDDPAHYRLVKWRLKVDELRSNAQKSTPSREIKRRACSTAPLRQGTSRATSGSSTAPEPAPSTKTARPTASALSCRKRSSKARRPTRLSCAR